MLLLATRNSHKVEEIRRFVPEKVKIVTLQDVNIHQEAEENGETFMENAIKKAVFYAQIADLPTIADDSGLVIDALSGFPGVKSARFMPGASYREKMQFILKMLEGKTDRTARFVCAATYYDPKEKLLICSEGVVEGHISEEIRGTFGFGYDPIFIPEGFHNTFGELDEVKHTISHRYRAFSKLFSLLSAIILAK
ncbi:MAG: Non-canonical purine NTP pyrophosphatase [Thermotoga sp. 50_1627]|uniref:RdgB/HAM1 family non-canonical purine NTP pyrophosphatase n=1 Tax=Pseudothermotoga sp. TaxID=2033661 RepID=UPI00076C0D4E|nr:MAG: Non-canonical purine NTP pyrophosphatase [Thermotoga sp. 50_64]KUK25623.1 MAG: Non-canonical purine NTP pyrophosphatase [Thermotoga sp. 50_1627]MBC7115534.1 RdgB/HAM1 family non-canonical purine NTP pyrophosphatase [Pseudothermotoga sp.]MDK2923068.1 XTP/dITP diphosphohydrolase [Pseudothermotoga sp.]HBT40048.1 non-canonical purine NTP pyrophosphatase, RdgB/HAM1 family [Pseudothermotoga sp.]